MNNKTLWDREEIVKMLRKIQIATMSSMDISEETASVDEYVTDTSLV